MDNLESIEEEVHALLSDLDVDTLEHCSQEILKLTVPDQCKGNKRLLLRLILRYLTSAEVEELEDEGLSIYLDLQNRLSKPLIKPKFETEPTFEMEKENPPAKSAVKDNPMNKHFEIHKEFKIKGNIGLPNEKDKLTYDSLSYQIRNAKAAGHGEQSICSAVIQAITPGINIRNYLETKPDLTLSSLTNILRSHYKEKDSTSTFTDLSNASQSQFESCSEFAIRLMSLRQKVLNLSKEEDCPFDMFLVQKRFLHALSTGIRNNNIRSELRDSLCNMYISDEELLKRIADAVAIENEHSEKISSRKREAHINNINQNNKTNSATEQDNLLQQLNEIKISNEKQFAVMCSEIQQIRESIKFKKGRPDNDPGFSNPNQNYPGFSNHNHNYPGFSNPNQNHPGFPNRNQNYPGFSYRNQSIPSPPPPQPQPSYPFYRQNPNNYRQQPRSSKCPNCSVTNARCNHCFVCGSSEHIKKDCRFAHSKNE